MSRRAGIWIAAVWTLGCTGCLVSPPAFSPDGRYLAYGVFAPPDSDSPAPAGTTGRVRIYDASAETVHTVPVAANREVFWPVWSHAGQRLALLCRDSQWSVLIYDHDLQSLRPLYRAPADAVLGPHLAWTPDDGAVIANQRAKGASFIVIRIDAETGEARRLGHGVFGWPLDATRVLWHRTQTRDYRVRFGAGDGLVVDDRPVHDAAGGYPHYPALSRDGAWVAYWRFEDSNRNGQYDADQDRAILVAGETMAASPAMVVRSTYINRGIWWTPVWNPAQNILTYLEPMEHNASKSQVMRYSLGTRIAEVLRGGALAVCWHPSGTWYAFTDIEGDAGPRTGVETKEGVRWLQ